jgi:exo-beta-1,3-glucanase (GH17 family)
MANVHPWFGNVSIDTAAAWTYEFFEQTNVAAAAALSNKPTMYIAETGWPSVQSI